MHSSLFSVTLGYLFVILLPQTGMLAADEFYVSPRGNDADAGTQSRPFRTLTRAQRAVRNSPQRGKAAITVYLREGKYYLDQTLVFDHTDSGTKNAPVTYTSLPGQQATISGGRPLPLTWEPYRDGIWRAPLAESLHTDQLFVNGQRQRMARYPNYDPNAQYFQGFAADCFSPERAARWRNPTGGYIHAMHRSHWGDFHYRITGKDEQHQVKYVGGWQNNRQMGMHDEHRFVENIKEELDAPGEWFLDQAEQQLYFHPAEGTDLATARIEAVQLRHLFEFRGTKQHPVRFLRLRNLKLTHTARTFMDNKEPLLRSDWTTYRGGAVLLDGAEHCSIEDCVVDQVGGNAIFVNNYNRHLKIAGNHIAKAGASAVSFVGDPEALRSPLFEYHQTQALEEMDRQPGPRSDNYPASCLVENNLIYRAGRVEKQTAGVNICMAAEITVRHNSIYDLPRAGINICDGAFGGHVIEWNDVFDTVKETGDHGSFNSWGRDRFWHKDRKQTEAWVRKHPDMPRWDCRKTNVIRNNRWRCDHGWDIDLDDGSSNYEIYNNLCLAGGIKLREGYFRNVYNNILVDYTFCPHVWYADCATTFRRNIIWLDEYAPAGMNPSDFSASFDENFVHIPKASQVEPASGLQQASMNDKRSRKGNAAFVDTLRGDYRVSARSPALAVGFRNFPMDRFGVQKPALRAIAKTPPLPGSLQAAAIRSGGWGRTYRLPSTAMWAGARVKNIENANEMSAAGLGDQQGVLVVSVEVGSAAEGMGLRANDVIRELNGPVENLAQLAHRFQQVEVGSSLQLAIWRNQAEATWRTKKLKLDD